MTLLVEKGTFTKTTTTTGLPFTQQVNLSNGSLTPKLLILWTTGHTSFNAFTDDSRLAYGFSDGTNDACQSYTMDESAEQERYVFRNDAVFCLISLTTGAIVSQADVSSFNAGNFVLNWTVQSDANALNIHYLVAGGTDITNVSVVNTTVGDTSTGNHSYNGSGTTFTPDFALTMTCAEDTSINTLASGSDFSIFAIGAAKSTSKRWVMWGREETFGTSDCDMYLDPANCMSSCSNTTGAITFLADFVSFNNAAGGGITINISDAAGASTKPLAFLLVKGGVWDCGAFQQRSGTGTQDVTIATGVDPELVFLGGINTDASATVTANDYLGIGASDGTNEGCSFAGNTNGLGTFAAVRNDSNTKVYRNATPNATATSSTINCECDMTGMATAGKFTLDWTTADTTLRQMVYWVLGVVSSTAYERSLSTETVTVGESLSRLYGAVRPMSTETTTISDTSQPTRMLSAIRNPQETTVITEDLTSAGSTFNRPLATETVTISEDLQRVRGAVVTLATETVTVGESLNRMLEATRTLPETTSVSEDLTRLLAATRTLDTEVTAVSDSLNRVVGNVRSLDTENVAVNESLNRLLAASRTLDTEVVTINETLERMLAATRTLQDTTNITEDLDTVYTPGGGGPTNYERGIIENTTISESLQRMLEAIRVLDSETTSISDQLDRSKGNFRTLPETTSIDDTLNRMLAATRAIASESTPVGEILNRLLAASRTISDTIGITDLLEHLKSSVGNQNFVRTLVENITISDSIRTWLSPIKIFKSIVGTFNSEGIRTVREGRKLTPNWFRNPFYTFEHKRTKARNEDTEGQ